MYIHWVIFLLLILHLQNLVPHNGTAYSVPELLASPKWHKQYSTYLHRNSKIKVKSAYMYMPMPSRPELIPVSEV